MDQPRTEVVWATVRGGTFANKNDQSQLLTRSADDVEYERHALIKFDTQHSIPEGSTVTSAKLTVTVKKGSEDATRMIGAYQITTSWDESEVTWKSRRKGVAWSAAGGDLGSRIAVQNVGNKAGTKVTFDVTALVKAAVAGDLGSSRYTRIALIDEDASTHESYREYHTPADSDAALRPVLKVTYTNGHTSKPPTPPPAPPPPTSSSSGTLRVLHWNTHHGGIGTDGKWDVARIIKWVAKVNPDVISLNEIEMNDGYSHNTNEPATIASLLKSATGRTWYYRFQTLTGGSSGIGVMVLSRFPIIGSSTKLLSGGRSAANIEVSVSGRTVNFTSTHLHPDSGGYRKEEIAELISWQKGLAESRIVAGDFNASGTSAENAAMKQAYYDSWAEADADGTAIGYPGNASGKTRNGRIDFIYFSHGSSSLKLKSSQVFDVRDSNGVMPSDHRPIMTVFTLK